MAWQQQSNGIARTNTVPGQNGQDLSTSGIWMTTGRDTSQIGAESRWREGIFLGLVDAGQGGNDSPPHQIVWRRLRRSSSNWTKVLGTSSFSRVRSGCHGTASDRTRRSGWRTQSRGQVFLCQPREGGDGGHSSECKTRVESAICDDGVGRNVSKNPRDE